MSFLLSDYIYDLPEHYIAQQPTLPQDHAKLLVCDGTVFSDYHFYDLPALLTTNDVLFFNTTKVYPARIPLKAVRLLRPNWEEKTIDWEIFVYKIVDATHMECMVSDDKHFKPGTTFFWNDSVVLQVVSLTHDWVLFSITWTLVEDFLLTYAQMPLPPYVHYTKEKEQWYQTIFAKYSWSSAAPTASLHFTQDLLYQLEKKWVTFDFATLHVWLGTFRPLYHEHITDNHIHEEELLISPDLFERIAQYIYQHNRIIAVGTTMTRYLESLPYIWKLFPQKVSAFAQDYWDMLTQDISLSEAEKVISWTPTKVGTSLFIYPGFSFRIVSSIITNFHLPKTSLLVMVSAFMGRDRTLAAYDYAKQKNYRFYSFWDWMWIKNP